MSIECGGGRTRSVKLAASPTLGGGGGGDRQRRHATLYLPGEGGGGVDLGAVGRALGLNPATVRLNGYYLSRGPNFVSGVTWDALLSFFAARGLATGVCGDGPVSVEGNPITFSGLHCPSDWHNGCSLSTKREAKLEDKISSKKNRINEHSLSSLHAEQSGENLCIKRKLELAAVDPLKRQKIADCNSRTVDSNDQQVSKADHLFIKRRSELEDDKRLKKQKISWCDSGTISFRDRSISNVDSLCIKRRPILFEGLFKRQKIAKCNSGEMDFRNRQATFHNKRSSKLEDNETFKKRRLKECTPVPIFHALNQEDDSNSSCICGRRILIFFLHHYPSTANGRQVLVPLRLALDGGVDLGAIGVALKLDPRTLRLNGYFLGRGSDLVSSLTWDVMLSFFAARGFPVGYSDCNPIIVHGKSLTAQDTTSFSGLLSAREGGDGKSSKRLVSLEYEIPCKMMKVAEVETRDGKRNPSCPCIRRPSPEDNIPSKKLKDAGPYSGLAIDGSAPPVVAWKNVLKCGSFSEHGKHLRDVMMPSVTCKKLR